MWHFRTKDFRQSLGVQLSFGVLSLQSREGAFCRADVWPSPSDRSASNSLGSLSGEYFAMRPAQELSGAGQSAAPRHLTCQMTTDGETPRSAGVRHDRRRVAVNFLTMVSTSGLALLINLLISIYIRRVLGPEGNRPGKLVIGSNDRYLAILVNPGLTTVGQRELRSWAPAGGEKPLIAVVVTIQTMLAMIGYGLVVAIAALGLRGETVSILASASRALPSSCCPRWISAGCSRLMSAWRRRILP